MLLLPLVAAPGAAAGAPAPSEALPRSPGAFADRLAAVTGDLHAAVDAWQEGGGGGRPPAAVELRALYHQRAHRALARRSPAFARRVIRRLPRRLRPGSRNLTAALRALFRLGGPPPARPRRFRTGPALAPATLRGFYAEGARRFGVPWQVLAAVNLVETNFNRLRSDSVAGARGPMQFLPSTWRAYGLGGDIRDPHDAILGAANYLRASGAPRRLRRALFAYNHSSLYVDAVLALRPPHARGGSQLRDPVVVAGVPAPARRRRPAADGAGDLASVELLEPHRDLACDGHGRRQPERPVRRRAGDVGQAPSTLLGDTKSPTGSRLGARFGVADAASGE
jgi:soluble lytic murein transglycosylase-like protein